MTLRCRTVGLGPLFAAFFFVGATSIGGGLVMHLRNSVVTRHRWMDDKKFVELLAISQPLPGLKAANLAVLIGDRLRGTLGAIAAIAGVCLPGAMLMYVVGLVYRVERERPLLEAGLEGVAAAAAGLVLAMTLQLGRQALSGAADLIFVVLTVICVNRLHMPVPYALAVVGALAVGWYASVGSTSSRSRNE